MLKVPAAKPPHFIFGIARRSGRSLGRVFAKSSVPKAFASRLTIEGNYPKEEKAKKKY
jgi:hypothetical protein